MKPTWDELSRRDLTELAQACARAGRTTVEAMLSRSNETRAATARRALYVELRALGWTLPKIGRFVGRHHTTVWSSLEGKP